MMCRAVRWEMDEMERHTPVGNAMRQMGFTYLGVLFAVAILGAVLGSTAVIWHTQVQRDKEQELLYIGHAFRNAIASYYEKTPGTNKQYPKKLEDLVDDKRQARLLRHLRKVYVDPMTGKKEWGLVTGQDAGIIGVYSLSKRAPIKSGKFDEEDREFVSASTYADWKFQHKPQLSAPTPAAQAPAGQAPGTPPSATPGTTPGATPPPSGTPSPNVTPNTAPAN